MGKNAIEIKGLKKVYKGRGGADDKLALKGIDLNIPQGSMFGLLGPNGAGKSTTINILAGLVNKSEGSASIWGLILMSIREMLVPTSALCLKN